jgi:hypothetical protein
MNKGKAKIQERVKEIKQCLCVCHFGFNPATNATVKSCPHCQPIAPSKGKCSCDVCKAIRKVAK